MPDRNPEGRIAASKQPPVSQSVNGKHYVPYKQSPLQEACDALASYETAYGLTTTIHTSLAVFVQEIVPELYERARSDRKVNPLDRADAILRTFFGTHLELDVLSQDAVADEIVRKKRAEALQVLALFEKIDPVRSVASEYVSKLGGTPSAANGQVS